jgi:Ca-activated chloride channel family protein
MLFDFSNPLFLLLLLLIPYFIWRRFSLISRNQESYLKYSDLSLIKGIKPGWRFYLHRALFYFKIVVFTLFVIALSGPRSGITYKEIETSGVDIMLTLDISSSMSSLDFKPKNRLEMAKDVVSQFIDQRESDRLGLVIFSAGAFTQCPLTLDHYLLKGLLKNVNIGMIEDGTAIGNALAVSVARLKDSQAKSKVITLLTDGMNNRGEIAPLDAAKLAADNKIKVYTIGAGKEGTALMPVDDAIYGKKHIEVEVKIDENTLQEIAKVTDGQYFRAENTEALKEIYAKINKMEKTVMKPKYYIDYEPLFRQPLIAGLLILVAVVFLETFIIRKTP